MKGKRRELCIGKIQEQNGNRCTRRPVDTDESGLLTWAIRSRLRTLLTRFALFSLECRDLSSPARQSLVAPKCGPKATPAPRVFGHSSTRQNDKLHGRFRVFENEGRLAQVHSPVALDRTLGLGLDERTRIKV
jgi:hypothetical protein